MSGCLYAGRVSSIPKSRALLGVGKGASGLKGWMSRSIRIGMSVRGSADWI